MRNLIFSFLVVLALVSFPLSAQTLAGPVVSAQAFPAVQPVAIGVPFTAAVVLQIQPGWHVNAHEGIPDFFIPLEVFLSPNSPLSLVGKVRYESGIPKSLAGESKPFAVYQGGTTLFLDLVLTSGAAEGPLPVKLQARYQACNDQVCMAPMNLPVNLDLTVGSSDQAVTPIHPEVFQNPLASPSQAAENIIAKFFREKGILITFVLIFLGGLALNLTPCVYPMIPLTVSYFGSQKAEKPLVILNRAFAYVLGISVTYSSLGVTAALTGRILGSTLQSPLVLVGISLVLMVLSFSMFGLYEIQAPNWLLNQVASGNTQGWIGALGMGLVFGIVAAPCVDPFSIGLLTYVAAKANPFLGFILFFHPLAGTGLPLPLARVFLGRNRPFTQGRNLDGLGEKGIRPGSFGNAPLFFGAPSARGLQPPGCPRLSGDWRDSLGLDIRGPIGGGALQDVSTNLWGGFDPWGAGVVPGLAQAGGILFQAL